MALASAAFAGDGFHAGPIFDQFSLTLDSGHRIEAIGPFLYHQEADTEKTWAVPPLFSYDADPAVELKEFDFGYPVLTCERYGGEYRWQFCQLQFCLWLESQRGCRSNALHAVSVLFSTTLAGSG